MSNLLRVSPENAAWFNPRFGSEIAGYPGIWRPVGLVVLDNLVTIRMIDESGRSEAHDIDDLEHLMSWARFDATLADGPEIGLHHRKGGKEEREAKLRILSISGDTGPHEQAELFFGIHDAHPGEVGYFLHAPHVAEVPLSKPQDMLTHQKEAELRIPLQDVVSKYFPIGAAANGRTV